MTGINGAQQLLETARELGVRICFANPGTTELTLVHALDAVPEIRPVLGLFEGVCTGAADGYSRVSGQVALTLLHLGPGFANGIANLHNARRAGSPIINIIGDHATWHLPFDAPLTSDIDSLAKPVSKAVLYLDSPDTLRDDVVRAYDLAMSAPGAVVTLIAPTDVMDAAPATGQNPVAPQSRKVGFNEVSKEEIVRCAQSIPSDRECILLLGGNALGEAAIRAAGRIAEKTGARLLMESYPRIANLGGDLPRLERLAYFPQDVLAQLGDATVVLVGAKTPTSYFGYEGQPSQLVSEDRLVSLASESDACAEALEALIDHLPSAAVRTVRDLPAIPPRSAELSADDIIEELVVQLPEGAVISLEGSTLGAPFFRQAHRARRHRVMTNTGGAIGQGLPCAVGAALGAPDARVVALQSDGSAQYTLQSLWTMARERLPVTIIMASNHRYGILQTELKRADVDLAQPAIEKLTVLADPKTDWTALAAGYGVEAVRVTTPAEFSAALRRGLELDGPLLIQAELP
ncbi:acetolactate synthase large subunit [Sphingobium cloacae]|uniref:Acetolactate synthase large subunit n=1 Tax=Sphingobium cloacae TaxID=120107 RepID=A0A1E1F1P9_9SPHN|nr:acetolactate synthase large subunit [Sphingobium cloacae]BAV64434.1 acetolactate synthase large subunit [Sphingobium cloacae]